MTDTIEKIPLENLKEDEAWVVHVITEVLGWDKRDYWVFLRFLIRDEDTTYSGFRVEEKDYRVVFNPYDNSMHDMYHETATVTPDIIVNRDVEGLCEVLRDAFENCPNRLATEEEKEQWGYEYLE